MLGLGGATACAGHPDYVVKASPGDVLSARKQFWQANAKVGRRVRCTHWLQVERWGSPLLFHRTSTNVKHHPQRFLRLVDTCIGGEEAVPT